MRAHASLYSSVNAGVCVCASLYVSESDVKALVAILCTIPVCGVNQARQASTTHSVGQPPAADEGRGPDTTCESMRTEEKRTR